MNKVVFKLIRKETVLKRNIYLILTLLIFSTICTFSQPKSTPYILTGGLQIGPNFYSADFQTLPGVYSCSQGYKKGSGIGYGGYLGVEYAFKKHFLGMRTRANLLLGLSDLSGEFSEEEFIGYIIFNEELINGMAEYNIKTNIKNIELNPGFLFYPLEKLPLNFRVGVQLGIPIKKYFEYKETLKAIDNVKYENWKRERTPADGDIKNFSSVLLSASVGARYEFLQFNKYSILAELNYKYYFTNFVKDLDWKNHALTLGVAVNYQIEKPEPLPPLQPPFPELPKTRETNDIKLALEVSKDNQLLSNNARIDVEMEKSLKINETPIIPIIYYKKNTAEMIDTSSIDSKGSYVEKLIFETVDQRSAVQLQVSYLNSENPEIVEQRMNDLILKLMNTGLARQYISTEKIEFTPQKNTHPEIAEEHCNIKMVIKNKDIVLYNRDTITTTSIKPFDLTVKPKIENQPADFKFTGEILLDGKKSYSLDLNKDKYNFYFNSKPDGIKMDISCSVQTADGLDAKDSKTYSIYSTEKITKVDKNYGMTDNEYYESYFLGFFDYDKSEFSIIDSDVLKYTKTALEKNRTVILIPYTDNFGTTGYNKKLAEARAEAAIKLFGNYGELITVKYPEGFIYSNSNPITRAYNRSVFIKIK